MQSIKSLILKRQRQLALLDKAKRLGDTYAQQIVKRQLKKLDLIIACWPMSPDHINAVL